MYSRLLNFFFALGALFLMQYSGKVAIAGNASANIYYVPFDFGTYVAVTLENIESDYVCKFAMDSNSKQAEELRAILEMVKPGNYEPTSIRLKIIGVFSDGVVVDYAGGLHSGKGENSQLTPEAFERLKTLMLFFEKSQVHNCKIKIFRNKK